MATIEQISETFSIPIDQVRAMRPSVRLTLANKVDG